MAAVKERNVLRKNTTNKVLTASLTERIKKIDTQNWIYVSPVDNKWTVRKWTVRKDGAERALRVYKQRSSALSAAKRIVSLSGGKHIIVYDSQGEISKIIK